MLESTRGDSPGLIYKFGVAAFLILLGTALLPARGLADAARILLDGEYADWDGIDPVSTETVGDEPHGFIDFTGLRIANDERYLFISLELVQEINLQSDNQIKLFLDTDNDPQTGIATQGIGAELVWTFGARSGIFTSPSGSYAVEPSEIGIVTAPTVTSERFEIAFDRAATPVGSTPLFGGPSIRIVIRDIAGTDVVPDEQGGALYTFDETPLVPLSPTGLARYDGADLRIVSYNVLRDGLFEASRRSHFDRLLGAIDPDIIGFQEIYNHSAVETESRVEAILPSAGWGRWHSSKAGSDIIVVSRYPITQSFNVSGNGAFLVDLRPTYDSDLLLVVAHPPCCSNETGRQREIDAFMAFIRDAKAPGGPLDLLPQTPIVIVGDMNLVGLRRQLETMLTGDIVNVATYGPPFRPDWDGSDLEDARPRHTDLPMTFTWYDEGSSFWPGRLDYIVYSGSVMDIANSYVAYTPTMTPDSLAYYGLQPEDAVRASDHIPVVADFVLPVSVVEAGIHCLDVGYGACTLITSPTGGSFLLDAGSDGMGQEVVAPYLADLGLTGLDYICASNYNSEHIGGIDEVIDYLSLDSVRVAVLDRGWSSTGPAYDDYVGSAGAKRMPVADGQSIDLGGGVTITCVGVNGNGELLPPFDDRYDEAELGVALVVEYQGFEFFAAGDLPGTDGAGHSDIESGVAHEVGDVDVYLVSDHGGGSSSGENLISALLPEVSIVSVGNDAPRGYPDQEVIDRLISYGSYIYQTERGTGGQIPEDRGEITGGHIILRVAAKSFSVNSTDTYEIEEGGIAISAVNSDDANGEPVLLGERVKLRGVVTAGSGVFSESSNDIFMQDATGGVNVFQQSLIDPPVELGDKVEVEGFVDSFAGLTRITGPTIRIKANGVSLPQPVPLPTGVAASQGAAYEGSLVELREVHVTGGSWPVVGSDGSLQVDDGSGECTLFIDEDAGIPGVSEIPDTFDVIGVMSQYDTVFPFLSGYRVMPRWSEDIRPSHQDDGGATAVLIARILPNPAKRDLRVVFTRSAAGLAKRIMFYDVRGRLIGRTEAGPGEAYVDWTASGPHGPIASGVYYAVVKADGQEETRKVVIMR